MLTLTERTTACNLLDDQLVVNYSGFIKTCFLYTNEIDNYLHTVHLIDESDGLQDEVIIWFLDWLGHVALLTNRSLSPVAACFCCHPGLLVDDNDDDDDVGYRFGCGRRVLLFGWRAAIAGSGGVSPLLSSCFDCGAPPLLGARACANGFLCFVIYLLICDRLPTSREMRVSAGSKSGFLLFSS